MRAGVVRAARGCVLAAGALGFCCSGAVAMVAYTVGLATERDVEAARAAEAEWRAQAVGQAARADGQFARANRLERDALALRVEIDRLRRMCTWGNCPWYIPAIPADEDDRIPPQRVPTREE